jgi:hypothetical protein
MHWALIVDYGGAKIFNGPLLDGSGDERTVLAVDLRLRSYTYIV